MYYFFTISHICVFVCRLGLDDVVVWINAKLGERSNDFRLEPTSNFWYPSRGWTPDGPPGTNDIANFNLAVTDTIFWDDLTANRNPDELQVLAGRYIFNNLASTQYELMPNSNSSSALLISGASTLATVQGSHFNVANGATIDGGATLNLDGSNNAGTLLSVAGSLKANGTLNVDAGGLVSSNGGFIAVSSGSTGVATITGSGSQWNNSTHLQIGISGTGTLNIANSGLVTVVGVTSIGAGGAVNLSGGRFEFGQTTLSEFGTN